MAGLKCTSGRGRVVGGEAEKADRGQMTEDLVGQSFRWRPTFWGF